MPPNNNPRFPARLPSRITLQPPQPRLSTLTPAPTPAPAPMSPHPSSSTSDTGSQSSSPRGYADVSFDPVLFGSPYSNSSSLSQSPAEQHPRLPQALQDASPATRTLTVIETATATVPKLGGCWTCRLRRKKCDEQRAEDGACATCRRLKLKCLGWGARRPDWMRDKDEVTRYKAEIKAHLLRQGLIRGQPRSGFVSTDPRPANRRNLSAPGHPYTRPHSAGSNNGHVSGWPMHNTVVSSSVEFLPNTFAGSSGAVTPSLVDASSLFLYDTTPPSASVTPSPVPPSIAGLNFEAYTSPLPTAIDDPRSSLVSYYFSDVKALTYASTCIAARTALWQALQKQANSPLESALCAIADVHFKKEETRSSSAGYAETHLSQFYFSEAISRLDVARRLRRLSSTDALAVSQMVAYCLATSGGTSPGSVPRWLDLVELSCDYVAQLKLISEPNPRSALRDMAPERSIAVKISMSMDIILSVTIQQPPRLLAVWRHVLGNTRGVDLSLSRHVGCSDAVLLMLGETAALAHWKAAEQSKGTLNHRLLLERAGAVERALQQHADTVIGASPVAGQGQLDDQIGITASGELVPANIDEQSCRQLVARVWWEAAVLYLKTVAYGHSPSVEGVPEIVVSVVQRLAVLPVTGLDRALVFPLMLTAAATDVPELRAALLARLVNIDRCSTNVHQIEATLQDVWRRRDAGIAQAVDWRDVMRANGTTLLLL